MHYIMSQLESQAALHNTKQEENMYLVKLQEADQFFN